MNPIQMIKNMILNKNINNPILKEVITKAQNGDTKGVEAFARNFLKEQGRDFDKEFNEFMKNFK
jgi:hypothetical protein